MLTHLNDRGEVELATRREVVRRVAEFDQFFSCYKDNQLKAQGAVATVAQLVNRKDSFTRMQMAHEAEQRRRREDMEAVAEARRAHQRALSQVRDDLFRLFGEQDAHKRGKSLEGVLARLFEVSGILVRDPFIVSEGGPIEQIDGAVELDGRLYLVEMKWCSEPLGRGEVAPHLVSVWGRAGAGGIFISASGFTDSAIADFKTALADRTVVLVELREVVRALDVGFPLADLLKAKVQEATLTKRPLTYPLEERS